MLSFLDYLVEDSLFENSQSQRCRSGECSPEQARDVFRRFGQIIRNESGTPVSIRFRIKPGTDTANRRMIAGLIDREGKVAVTNTGEGYNDLGLLFPRAIQTISARAGYEPDPRNPSWLQGDEQGNVDIPIKNPSIVKSASQKRSLQEKKSAAWQRKEGKNPEGGLNEKGRKSYERENPGSDLKAPQPKGGKRRDSFCARMKGMKRKLTSAKTANDPDSRINKSLRAWNC